MIARMTPEELRLWLDGYDFSALTDDELEQIAAGAAGSEVLFAKVRRRGD